MVLVPQILGECSIDLNGDYPTSSFHQNIRQRAATRPYLNDGVTPRRRQCVDDSSENCFVGEEMLAELLEDRRPSTTPAGRVRHLQLLTTTSVRSSRSDTPRV